MPITFACPRCGKSYSVDPSLAGRTGKCKACGRPMTIPTFYDDGDDTIATEGYDLSSPEAAAVGTEEQTVFVPAGRDPDERSQPRRRKRPTGGASRPERSRREDDEPFHVRHRASLIGAPIVLLAALGLAAALVPNGTLIAACVLASLGGLLVLVGYTVGAWAAFREDSLYGFFYLVFPLYTAYYILTRFEDLWPWFLAMTVGAGLVTVGGTIAESKLRDKPEQAAAQAELGVAAGPSRLVRIKTERLPVVAEADRGGWGLVGETPVRGSFHRGLADKTPATRREARHAYG